MSLSNSGSKRYLKIRDSEQRVSAVFLSVSIQSQLDQIVTNLSLLTGIISMLVELHDKEHPDSSIINDDTNTDILELLAEHEQQQQPAITGLKNKQPQHSPYI